MNHRENHMVERIDRSREAPAAKAARSARAMFLRMRARQTIYALLSEMGDDAERSVILGDLIDIAAEHRHPIIGRVETATSLNSVAADVCASLRLPLAVAKARAEQLFTRAANDRSDG